MKKQALIIFIFLLFSSNNGVFSDFNDIKIELDSKNSIKEITKDYSRGESFIFLSNLLPEIPSSSKYIKLNFRGIENDTKLYYSLQKLVYLDLLDNLEQNIFPDKNINAYIFYRLAEKFLGKTIISPKEKNILKDRFVNDDDFKRISKIKIFKEKELKIKKFEIKNASKELKIKQAIFIDVYNTLLKSHYNKDELTQTKIWNGAIDGITRGANDKYTSYFPKIDNKNFQENLNGEYEGIGSYVDMERPGKLRIISPITGSPSYKAGIKGGDIIIKVDGKLIKKDNSLGEVISWIKGPAGTKVILTVVRDGKTFDLTVIRGKIVIKDIEYKLLNNKTFYINIKTFGNGISNSFKGSLKSLKNKRSVNKVIIDLRNNGGGYLDEVSKMLGYFVPKGEPTAIIEYLDGEKNYISLGYDLIDFSDYKIVLLQNSGTASASEIMIGTIKDYYPDSVIIGKKSFGKGSVQTIKTYKDGSSLKYTIAKWFTGKNKIGIDGVGITPDIELELDRNIKEYDSVINKAIDIK